MISDSSLTTDTKLRYLGPLPLKEKRMLNEAVLAFKAYRNLAPPYLKQVFICSNTRATSRFITLPEPRIGLFKTRFSFSGASLWNTIPTQIKSCSSLTSFKTAPQMVQKQFVVNTLPPPPPPPSAPPPPPKGKKKKRIIIIINFLVSNVYIHACIERIRRGC